MDICWQNPADSQFALLHISVQSPGPWNGDILQILGIPQKSNWTIILGKQSKGLGVLKDSSSLVPRVAFQMSRERGTLTQHVIWLLLSLSTDLAKSALSLPLCFNWLISYCCRVICLRENSINLQLKLHNAILYPFGKTTCSSISLHYAFFFHQLYSAALLWRNEFGLEPQASNWKCYNILYSLRCRMKLM